MANAINKTENGEFKKCVLCKVSRPLTEFKKMGKKTAIVCNHCVEIYNNNKQDISSFESRELIEELINRGYRGKLQYVQTINVAI